MYTNPDIATYLYYTGIDPFTKKEVHVAKGINDRKMQRAIMQFFKPENYFTVREALIAAGRADLIGGCEGLIPAQPQKEALEARCRQANNAVQGDHYHTVANPAKGEKPGERGLGHRNQPATGPEGSHSSGNRGGRNERDQARRADHASTALAA